MKRTTKRVWYTSRSVWLGILTCLGSLLSFIQGHELVRENPTAVSVIGLVVGCLIIICRFISPTPVSFRK